MREHKYKIWHKELKRMFEVSWFNFDCGENGNINCGLVPLPKIKEAIILEYIGLNDKNEKEIYGDCDLLQDDEGVIYMAKWWKQKAGYKLWYWDGTEWDWDNDIEDFYDWKKDNGCLDLEFIGDIFQNEDLLHREPIDA